MDHKETKLVQEENEGSAVDFNSANRIRNKTLRRAQVHKDKRHKKKVCVVLCRLPRIVWVPPCLL
jgi:hypothetical protein